MRIKLLVCDVDGTLTDNKSCVSNDGTVTKNFCVLDGMGIALVRQRGIKVAWVTGSGEECITHRAKHCNIDLLKLKAKDKVEIIDEILERYNMTWDNVAYIGDDINDLDGIQKAAFSAVPADAIIAELGVHDYTCKRKGGEGAVREFADLLLQKTLQRTW